MRRRGFTLVELLVAVAIILVLMTLASVAASAARTSAKVTATRSLITRLENVLLEHIALCEAKPVNTSIRPPGMSDIKPGDYRAWFIRRNLITGDMPDRWDDVKYMSENPADFQTSAQQSYIEIWRSLRPEQQAATGPKSVAVKLANSSAECLFMVVMRGGIGDCLSCGGVGNSANAAPRIGDEDQDGMPEFHDAWGNPIGYLLWAPALQLPASTKQLFFSSGNRSLDQPFAGNGAIRPSLGMRPLIYSIGYDGESGLDRTDEAVTLNMGSPPGRDCGNPQGAGSQAGGLIPGPDYRGDNLTNFDAEARQ